MMPRRVTLAILLAALGLMSTLPSVISLLAPFVAVTRQSDTSGPARQPPAPSADSRYTYLPLLRKPSDQRPELVGYFTEWGVYSGYHVKNIKSSGSAGKLTRINYAFGNVVDARCQLGDTDADYQRFYSAAESVDGVADTSEAGALHGSFNQFSKLKRQYPDLKLLISLGGASWSGGFSDAALPANRVAFVKSCIDLFIVDARWAGLFDGIDVDWEFPGVCGDTCNARPEDTQNFTALLAEFRRQLNAVRPGLLLTIAAPAGSDYIAKYQINQIHQHLDAVNLMAYDFHGTWDTTTGFHSALHPAGGDPARADRLTVAEAVATWLQGGLPASKLIVGVPFYGRGWRGVPSADNGLWQTSSGAAPGTIEAGMENYNVLKSKGYTRFFQAEAQAAWLYHNGIFWTYDDPEVMAIKMRFVESTGLAGVMFWELSGDTASGELIGALYASR
jgi:chitinase